MENMIIIGIVVIIVAMSILYTVKHFKGEGSCCGGGSSYKPKRKKLENIRYTKTFFVDGMHCEHCKSRVEEIIGDIHGISGKVNLKKGTLTVSYSEDVDDETIRQKLSRVGYTLQKRENTSVSRT